MIYIKRNFMGGVWVVALLGLSALSGCTASDDSTVSTGRVLMVNGIVGSNNTSRTAVDITDPQNLNPNYGKGEGFIWSSGDKVAAYAISADAKTTGTKVDIEATHINKATADFAIPTDGLPSAGKCYLYYPSGAANGSAVTMSMPSNNLYNSADYAKYDFMYADAINYTTATELQSGYSTRFQHLGALLRFNIWNATNKPYTIKSCTVSYVNGALPQPVIPQSMSYDLIQGTSTFSNYSQMQTYQNGNYQNDAALTDVATTTYLNEAVYDALMPILPTKGTSEGYCLLSVIVYDKNTKIEHSLLPLYIPCSKYKFFTEGFKAGMRYYFSLDITDNQLKLKNISVIPWNDGGTTSADTYHVIANLPFAEILKAAPYNIPVGPDGYIHPDDAVTKSALNDITQIRISGNRDLTSLDGIQYCTNLTYLACKECALTSLDLSNNIQLQHLEVNNNSLTSLDLSKNIQLVNLYVGDNSLTYLDLSNNIQLQKLSVINNSLISLDLSNNIQLQHLGVNNNSLESLDLSKNIKLVVLAVGDNSLKSLDLSKNIQLQHLEVNNNSLTSLDLSKNIQLVDLAVDNNSLKSLDLSKNIQLQYLNVYGNSLTSLDLFNNIQLGRLNCRKNQMSALNITKNNKLSVFLCNAQTNNGGTSQTINVTLTADQNKKLASSLAYEDITTTIE